LYCVQLRAGIKGVRVLLIWNQMASSQNPGDPTYRRSLGEGGLVLRWSTTEDKAGCVLLSCLAVQEPEGQESERAFRYFEPSMDDAFHAGSSYVSALHLTDHR
jgi:hypothetical protein